MQGEWLISDVLSSEWSDMTLVSKLLYDLALTPGWKTSKGLTLVYIRWWEWALRACTDTDLFSRDAFKLNELEEKVTPAGHTPESYSKVPSAILVNQAASFMLVRRKLQTPLYLILLWYLMMCFMFWGFKRNSFHCNPSFPLHCYFTVRSELLQSEDSPANVKLKTKQNKTKDFDWKMSWQSWYWRWWAAISEQPGFPLLGLQKINYSKLLNCLFGARELWELYFMFPAAFIGQNAKWKKTKH